MTSSNECGGPARGPLSGGDPGALYGEDLVRGPTRASRRSRPNLLISSRNHGTVERFAETLVRELAA